MEGDQLADAARRVIAVQAAGHDPVGAHQGDALLVGRQPVEGGAVQAGEALQLLQGPLLLEHLRVAGERHRGVVDTGAAAGALLGVAGMGC